MQAGKNISASEIFSDYSDSHPYRCVGGNGLRGYTENFNTHGHYSIVGRQGALCGCINIEKGKFYATEHAVVVDAYEILSPTFMYYFLTALNLNKYATATAQPGLAVSNVLEVMCPLPPLNEGERIIKKLVVLIPLTEKYNAIQVKQDTFNKAIKELLKKSILQEAIQGKLVSQDPSDETASELLKRIREEKQKLVKEGKLKKKDITDSVIFKGDDNRHYEKIGNAVTCIENEIPFDIPDSWQWVRLNDICEYIQRGKSPKYSDIKRFPVVAQKCNQWSGFSLKKALFIDPDTIKSYREERFLQDGDLMWNSTGLGTLGRMAIYTSAENPYGVAVADSHVTVIRAMRNYTVSQYLYSYFASNTVQSVIEDKADGSTKQKELATATVKSYLVPLPPYNEQRRIVQRINELFSKL